MGQSAYLGPALLHALEDLPVKTMDLTTLFGSSTKTPEEACTQVGSLVLWFGVVVGAVVGIVDAVVDVLDAVVDVLDAVVDVLDAVVDVLDAVVDVLDAVVGVVGAVVGVVDAIV